MSKKIISIILSKITFKFIFKCFILIILIIFIFLLSKITINYFENKPFIEGHRNFDFDYNTSETLNLKNEIEVEYYGKYKRVKKCCSIFNDKKNTTYFLVFKDKNIQKYYKFKVDFLSLHGNYKGINKIYFYNLKDDKNIEAFVLSNDKVFKTYFYEGIKLDDLVPSETSKFKAKWY